ncbi:MAG: tyrosine-type recombinase/integrase [Thaumarchaeota archaeon]|nr:tyrosine-type recombinase/integrase [Nitrososphaerota archaeon]
MSNTYALIEKELSPYNIELIKKYDSELVKQSLAKATRLKHLQILLNLSRFIKKDWNEITKDDIDKLVMRVVQLYGSDSGQETNTTWDHKKILKIFFRWFKTGSRNFREVGDPIETKSVKLRPVKDNIVREDLLTEDDRTRLLYACGENARDRAFIDVHFEGGTRPGEILSLRIKHVKFDSVGAVISVDGKTGPRPIRLIRSVPNLAKWLDVHPLKNNPEAPLWMVLDKSRFGEPLNNSGARALLQRRCEMAHMLKRVNLKLFRHSEATRSANFMTEAQMRVRHGWTPSSKMPARYVHLVSADVDQALLKHYGIEKEVEKTVVLPRKCTICQMQNSPESTTCSNCGRPFDLATAMKIDDATESRLSSIEEKLNSLLSALQK